MIRWLTKKMLRAIIATTTTPKILIGTFLSNFTSTPPYRLLYQFMPILTLALSSAESALRKTPPIPLNKPVSDKLPPAAAKSPPLSSIPSEKPAAVFKYP